jgi:hypothetical protein
VDNLRDYAPNAIVVRIEDGGHRPMKSHPMLVNRAIPDFLSGRMLRTPRRARNFRNWRHIADERCRARSAKSPRTCSNIPVSLKRVLETGFDNTARPGSQCWTALEANALCLTGNDQCRFKFTVINVRKPTLAGIFPFPGVDCLGARQTSCHPNGPRFRQNFRVAGMVNSLRGCSFCYVPLFSTTTAAAPL